MPDQYQYLQGTPGAAAQRLRRQVDALRDCRGPHVFDATDVRLVLEYLEANERARLAEHDAYDRQYEHTGLMPSSRHSSDTDESPTSSRTELRKAWLTGIRVKHPAETLDTKLASLPEGVSVTRVRIEVRFNGAKEAVKRLYALAHALINDYERFEALVGGGEVESRGEVVNE